METLPSEFTDCLARIEINGTKQARAAEAHKEIRSYLETRSRLVEWGINTLLIGSYARRTGIYPGKDVDIFSKLTKLSTNTSPGEVFEEVRDALVSHYGERAVIQPRSIKVTFPEDDFSVDVVPAVQSGSRWAIPSRNTEDWAPGRSWIETDPEKLNGLTVEQNTAPLVSGRGAYVPVVKLARQIRTHHLGDAKPGGLYLELATYWTFREGVAGDSFAVILGYVLKSLRDKLLAYQDEPLIDPVLGSEYRPKPEVDELSRAADVFGRLAKDADEALAKDRCQAGVLWRKIIGENERGLCFPIPEGCDERGRVVAPVRANVGWGADEARGFGRYVDN